MLPYLKNVAILGKILHFFKKCLNFSEKCYNFIFSNHVRGKNLLSFGLTFTLFEITAKLRFRGHVALRNFKICYFTFSNPERVENWLCFTRYLLRFLRYRPIQINAKNLTFHDLSVSHFKTLN